MTSSSTITDAKLNYTDQPAEPQTAGSSSESTASPKPRILLTYLDLLWEKIPVCVVDLEDDDFGQYSYELNEIFISGDCLKRGEFYDTLLHEAIHAVEDMAGLKLKEGAVRIMGAGLVQMLGAHLDTNGLLWDKYQECCAELKAKG
jgi:hypothetical protein